MRCRDESGQALVLVLGVAVIAFATLGLALDGTRALLLRRTLQNAADGAALAGTSAIDATDYYRSGGRDVTLDRRRAHRAAVEWLRLRGLPAEAEVGVRGSRIEVFLQARTETSLLRLVGVASIRVSARAVGQPKTDPF